MLSKMIGREDFQIARIAKIIKIDRTTLIEKKATNTNYSCGKDLMPFDLPFFPTNNKN